MVVLQCLQNIGERLKKRVIIRILIARVIGTRGVGAAVGRL